MQNNLQQLLKCSLENLCEDDLRKINFFVQNADKQEKFLHAQKKYFEKKLDFVENDFNVKQFSNENFEKILLQAPSNNSQSIFKNIAHKLHLDKFHIDFTPNFSSTYKYVIMLDDVPKNLPNCKNKILLKRQDELQFTEFSKLIIEQYEIFLNNPFFKLYFLQMQMLMQNPVAQIEKFCNLSFENINDFIFYESWLEQIDLKKSLEKQMLKPCSSTKIIKIQEPYKFFGINSKFSLC